MEKQSHSYLALATVVGVVAIIVTMSAVTKTNNFFADLTERQAAAVTLAVPNLWTYYFNVPGTLAEGGSMSESSSPYFWLNSGGRMYIRNGIGMTIAGELPTNDVWRKLYLSDNPIDTDNGFHPQNLFRLVTRNKWQNYTEELYFKTDKVNLSDSLERNAWSGILLFNRYQDGDNLYYAGVRDDGHVVIKSKKHGIYKTLAENALFAGTYNRVTNPSLLPLNQWMGIKTEVMTLPNNTVSIKLYVDQNKTGIWTLALETIDATNPILSAGYAGIRTDFRDAEFDNFKIVKQ